MFFSVRRHYLSRNRGCPNLIRDSRGPSSINSNKARTPTGRHHNNNNGLRRRHNSNSSSRGHPGTRSAPGTLFGRRCPRTPHSAARYRRNNDRRSTITCNRDSRRHRKNNNNNNNIDNNSRHRRRRHYSSWNAVPRWPGSRTDHRRSDRKTVSCRGGPPGTVRAPATTTKK